MISRFVAHVRSWIWVIGAVIVALFLFWRYQSLTNRVRIARTGARHAEEARRLGKDVEAMETMRQTFDDDARSSAAKAQKIRDQAFKKATEIRSHGFQGVAKLVEDWNAGA